MPNLLTLGERLQNRLRAGVDAHSVSLRREAGGVTVVGPFSASSSPIGHTLLANDAGLHLSEHERVLYWEREITDPLLGSPQLGDVVIDHDDDDSRWRVIPNEENDAWRYHGQGRVMYQVFCKRDG